MITNRFNLLKHSEMLSLVDIRKDHLQDIFEYSGDPEFCRYLGSNTPGTPAEVYPFVEMLIRENALGLRKYFAILSDGKIVGTTGLLNINENLNTAELGYGIDRRLWGTGIIQQCVSHVIYIAFNQMQIAYLRVGMNSENLRSRFFIEKMGFVKISSDEYKTWYGLRK